MKAILSPEVGQVRFSFDYTIPSNFTSIKSIGEFTHKYRTKKGNLNKQYISIYNKLLLLSSNISKHYGVKIDPIVYMHFLYFGDGRGSGMSCYDMSLRLKDIGVDFGERKNFWRILTNVLNFDLRDAHEETVIKNKKDKYKATHLEIHKKSKEESRKKIEEILSQTQPIDKKIEVIGTKRVKITQILFQGSLLKENNPSKLTIFLQGLYSQGLGSRRIVTILLEVLDSIYPNNGIKLDSKEVLTWSKLKIDN